MKSMKSMKSVEDEQNSKDTHLEAALYDKDVVMSVQEE